MPTLDRGWMPGVERVVSSAIWVAEDWPDREKLAVMSHIMQGYQSTMVAWAKQNPYRTQKSAHFTISRAGTIIQHVSLYDFSWSAGKPDRPSWSLLPSGWARSCNWLVVNVEHEGFSKPPGYGYDYIYSAARPWPSAMLKATIDVHEYVFEELQLAAPDYGTVIGHRDTDGRTRADDPGAVWPQGMIVRSISRAAGSGSTHPTGGGSLPPAVDPALEQRIDALEGRATGLEQRDAEHQSWHRTA